MFALINESPKDSDTLQLTMAIPTDNSPYRVVNTLGV